MTSFLRHSPFIILALCALYWAIARMMGAGLRVRQRETELEHGMHGPYTGCECRSCERLRGRE